MRITSIDACMNDEERKQVVADVLWRGIQKLEAEKAAKANNAPEATTPPVTDADTLLSADPTRGSENEVLSRRATTTARRKAVEL